MGFRGEALASMAACSKLTISSNGSRLVIDNGIRDSIINDSSKKGCTIIMENLFERMPARKQFLKRPSSEGTNCRKILVEKAICFPQIEFSYYEDSSLKLHLDKTDIKNRILQIMALDRDFVPTQSVIMSEKSENIRLYAIASHPSCYRKDRTRIRVFLNKRPIDSYQLVQAITNSYSVALPGGAFPYFTLIINDEPALVDFNVHPAKRECRIRNQSEVYSLICQMIRKSLLDDSFSKKKGTASIPVQKEIFNTVTSQKIGHQARITFSNTHISKADEVKETKPFDTTWFEKAKQIMEKKSAEKESVIPSYEENYKYLGQLFNTFLLVEKGSELYIIDQHASHERILYDEITSCPNTQKLMVPYRFETDRSADDFLLENSFIYQDLGVELIRIQPMLWEMTTVPAIAGKTEEKLADFIKTATGDVEEAKKGLFAVIACHKAIKAGDILDELSAKKLIEKVFALDEMRCPHGRSFVKILKKEELYEAVGRTL